eukprot:TRINITY_DN9569_c0_g1_i9.p1 TRINITY_DN9569_c0_g1~~TRINITY_DN9569_c0_g1_i9.p1  ORF type:complete len:765 (-),score=225.36 TRINITY_DN9569_c0_g1_i9:150-2444(-)
MARAQLGFPLWGMSPYLDRVAVAGGGGAGNHGIPNKLVLLNADLSTHSEHTMQEEAIMVSTPDPALAPAVYRSCLAVTLPTKCIIYSQQLPLQQPNSQLLLEFRSKLAQLSTQLPALGVVQDATKALNGLVFDDQGQLDRAAVSEAAKAAAAAVHAMVRAGEASNASVLFDLQRMLVLYKRNKHKMQESSSSDSLVRCGLFEIELQDDETELAFSVLSPCGDLLVMGTNQGMFITFKYYPDGHMQVQETCSDLDLNQRLLRASFSPTGRWLAFISEKKCWFLNSADAADEGASVCSQRCVESKTPESRFRRCHWLNDDTLLVLVLSSIPKSTKMISRMQVYKYDGQTVVDHACVLLKQGTITSFSNSKNGELVACGDDDGMIHMFRSNDFGQLRSFQAHSAAVSDISFIESDRTMVSSSVLASSVARTDISGDLTIKGGSKKWMVLFAILIVPMACLVGMYQTEVQSHLNSVGASVGLGNLWSSADPPVAHGVDVASDTSSILMGGSTTAGHEATHHWEHGTSPEDGPTERAETQGGAQEGEATNEEGATDEEAAEGATDEEAAEGATDEEAAEGATNEEAAEGATNEEAAEGATNEEATEGATNEEAAEGAINEEAAEGATNEEAAEGATDEEAAEGATDEEAAEGATNEEAAEGAINEEAAEGAINEEAAEGATNEEAAEGATNEEATEGATNEEAAEGATNEEAAEGATNEEAAPWPEETSPEEASNDAAANDGTRDAAISNEVTEDEDEIFSDDEEGENQ